VAISESENPDAIALRSAISLLQLQREKSKRDLKALADLKSAAVSDPAAFARSIQDQRAHASPSNNHVLAPTLAGLAEEAHDAAHVPVVQPGAGEHKDLTMTETKPSTPKLPAIPQPQNVVRCPPVNWAKYHIVGEPLDKMHEEQRKWPGQSVPPRTQSGARLPPHAIAAPYSPFTDGIGKSSSTAQSSKGSKKAQQ
jgi:hypothetical protein